MINDVDVVNETFAELTAATMLGELMACTLDELKHAQDAWQKLSQDEQDRTIERVQNRVKNAVTQAVGLIATGGYARIPATLESATIKDGIKVVCQVAKHDAKRHELLDATGSVVHLVLAANFVDAPHGHKSEPEQGDLALNALGDIANSDDSKPEDDSGETT